VASLERLVERFRDLVALHRAGNTAHRNEMVSVCRELVRSGVMTQQQCESLGL